MTPKCISVAHTSPRTPGIYFNSLWKSFTWQIGISNLSCPRINSWFPRPQTFSTQFSCLNKCLLLSSTHLSPRSWGHPWYLCLLHPTANPLSNPSNSTFKVYSEMCFLWHAPLPLWIKLPFSLFQYECKHKNCQNSYKELLHTEYPDLQMLHIFLQFLFISLISLFFPLSNI